MKNIHVFFNDLKVGLGAVWVINDTLKLSAPKQFQNEVIKNFIIKNKEQMVSILSENAIFSKEDFTKKTILTDASRKFYPLSPAQERLWFIEQYEQGTNAYHIPMYIVEFSSNMLLSLFFDLY